jgi:hypothetical protein
VGADLNIKFQGFKLNANYTYSQQAAQSRNARWGDVPTPLATGPIDFNFSMSRLFVDAGYETQFIPDVWTATFNVTYNGNNVRLGRPELPNDRDDILSNDVLVEWTNFLKPIENMNIIVGGLTNTQTGTHIVYNTINNNTLFGAPFAQTKDPNAPLNSNPFNILPTYNQTWWSAYFQRLQNCESAETYRWGTGQQSYVVADRFCAASGSSLEYYGIIWRKNFVRRSVSLRISI